MKNKIVRILALTCAAGLAITSLTGCNSLSNVLNRQSSTITTPEAPSTIEVTTETEKPSNPEMTSEEQSGSLNATQEDYLKFINGEVKMTAGNDCFPELKKGQEYTFDEMVDGINEYLEDSFGEMGMFVMDVSYAFVDCGNDGIPEMALSATCNTEDYYNQLDGYFILKCVDGKITLIDYYESFYRAFGTLNKYGIFCTSGSGGAAIHYYSYERANKDGEHEFIFDCEEEVNYGEPLVEGYMIPSDVTLPEGYPDYMEKTGDLVSNKYCFMEYSMDFDTDESKYNEYKRSHVYVFTDADGKIVFPSDEYMKFYEEAGIKVVDQETINRMIDDRLKELGISPEEMGAGFGDDTDSSDDEPQWTMCADYVHTENQGGN